MSAPEQDARGPSSNDAPSTSGSASPADKPTVMIVIGMAGSGKTTLMQRINSYLHQQGTPGYLVNLDPAVLNVPYDANIDIRDTVNYKNVMKQYQLGPNGGILTSLNLFATKFDQVLSLCEKAREPQPPYVVVDTPGQIEIFTWSASGSIITQAFASALPTCVCFVIDTPRCAQPQTFMSNMLQACSILYKTRLPLLLVYNKADVTSPDFAIEWMSDFDVFNEALQADATYASTLSRSLSLVLEEFYEQLQHVAVSAVTGEGMPALFDAVQRCREEYDQYYKPELERKVKARKEEEQRRQEEELAKLRADVAEDQSALGKVVLDMSQQKQQQGGGT